MFFPLALLKGIPLRLVACKRNDRAEMQTGAAGTAGAQGKAGKELL